MKPTEIISHILEISGNHKASVEIKKALASLNRKGGKEHKNKKQAIRKLMLVAGVFEELQEIVERFTKKK